MIPPLKKWDFIGGMVPLLDRLVDSNPDTQEEATPLVHYTKQQLIESVIREASNILNTRCTIPYKEYQDMEPSTLTYGIPDLYGLFDASYADPSRAEDRIKLSRFIANTLRMFDPRLEDISVEIDRYNQMNQTVYLTIHATLIMNTMKEAVSFPLALERQ